MELSVVLVNWNTRDLTLGCLRSVRRHLGVEPAEVLVVDNGSVDGSVEAIRRDFPLVRILRNSVNRGYAAAVNRALRLARGPFVLLLNTDAELHEGTVAAMARWLRENPRAAAAGPQLVSKDGVPEHSFVHLPSLATELLHKDLLRWIWPERFPSKRGKHTGPVEVPSLVGACMLVRKETLDEIGYLDERYFVFLEETDWCRRARENGWKIWFLPHCRATHLKGRSKQLEKVRARVEYQRSILKYFRKWHGSTAYALLRLLRPVRVLGEILGWTAAAALTLGQSPSALGRLSAALYELLWHLAGCRRKMGLTENALPVGKLGGLLTHYRLEETSAYRRWLRQDVLEDGLLIEFLENVLRCRSLLGAFEKAGAKPLKAYRIKSSYLLDLPFLPRGCDPNVRAGKTRRFLIKYYRSAIEEWRFLRGDDLGSWSERLGGFFRLAGRWRYLLRSKARKESEAQVVAYQKGVPTILPLAVADRKRFGLAAGSFVIFDWEGQSQSMDELVRAAVASRSTSQGARGFSRLRKIALAYGRFARFVHDAGVLQDDFDPNNVLVRFEGDKPLFRLIDFERVDPSRFLRAEDRAWSLAKAARRTRGVPEALRRAFLSGYFEGTDSSGALWAWHENEIGSRRSFLGLLEEARLHLVVRDACRMRRNSTTVNRNFASCRFGPWRGYLRRRFPFGGAPLLSPADLKALRAQIDDVQNATLGERAMKWVIGGSRVTVVVVPSERLRGWRRLNMLWHLGVPGIFPLAGLIKGGLLTRGQELLVYARSRAIEEVRPDKTVFWSPEEPTWQGRMKRLSNQELFDWGHVVGMLQLAGFQLSEVEANGWALMREEGRNRVTLARPEKISWRLPSWAIRFPSASPSFSIPRDIPCWLVTSAEEPRDDFETLLLALGLAWGWTQEKTLVFRRGYQRALAGQARILDGVAWGVSEKSR